MPGWPGLPDPVIVDDGSDVRGRVVVLAVGPNAGQPGGIERRLWLGRLALVGAALAALVALVTGTAAWSVLTPVGSTPSTPLWVAPSSSVAEGKDRSGTAAASARPSAGPTAHPGVHDPAENGNLGEPRSGADKPGGDNAQHGSRRSQGSTNSRSSKASTGGNHEDGGHADSGSDR